MNLLGQWTNGYCVHAIVDVSSFICPDIFEFMGLQRHDIIGSFRRVFFKSEYGKVQYSTSIIMRRICATTTTNNHACALQRRSPLWKRELRAVSFYITSFIHVG